MYVVQDLKEAYLFVSVPINAAFRNFLAALVGEDNVVTYTDYIE